MLDKTLNGRIGISMNMFGITYDTWKQTCLMYFNLSSGSKKTSLQWFPFSRINKNDEEFIISEDFFNKYIKQASFVLFPKVMYQSENFLQKGDGSFRDSSLLSPILYLVLQAIGKEISMHYHSLSDSRINVFYAGNYEYSRAKYKQDYDEFFKLINTERINYKYFIKTDISNFFSNINLDILISMIDKGCNEDKINFTPTQLKLIKELLYYCGAGKFPTIENSIASSYLATIVYMNEIDNHICKFISDNIGYNSSFKIIRYVDDMYILINTESNITNINNKIRNEYSSILKEYGLSLNSKKYCFSPITEINNELKKSLYDEYFNGIKHSIEELFAGELQKFLESLLCCLRKNYIDINKYNSLIDEHFRKKGVEFTSTEVFNYFIYESENSFQDGKIVNTICDLINTDISFISLDPKRLTTMIVNTKSNIAIKALLHQLLKRNENGLWNSYDTSIAISYLIQRSFKHTVLIDALYKNSKDLKNYCLDCCTNNFLTIFKDKKAENFLKIINNDWKTYFLYFMYWIEKKRNNILSEFAFYKSFFDRFTADLDFYYKDSDSKQKKPNYNAFYKEHQLKNFYKDVDANSDVVISSAQMLRHANPLCHSSSELIDSNTTSKELKKCIVNLNKLICDYIIINNKNKSNNKTLRC